ncbi:MAG: Asp-tRNA(Asn)/Glu-tRNA(Gln) amidotransferase A subunit family amidase [Gammaproteobacteria bacterium]|jgi:Asp-tRNA(Asn)/Glu-tRNA(Gln) amidotransferase A subunit family amidase
MSATIKIVISTTLYFGLIACAEHPPIQSRDKLNDIELRELSAVDASALIKSKQITATELVKAVIHNAKQYNHLNAYITLDESRALLEAARVDKSVLAGTASGKLLGVPLIIKDNIEVADMPITAGTPSMQGIVPKQHAPVVQFLVDEGAIILGKANMHELAFGVTSNNKHFGAVHNPYKQDFFAGGSSGGTAAALASRGATVGLGSDTGGSVRLPAALCGIFGFRPSSGRYPQGGVVPLSSTRDIVGPMARTVGDLILLDAVIVGRQPDYQAADIASIRLGIPRAYFYANLEPGVSELISKSLKIIANAGIKLIEVDLEIPADIEAEIGFPLVIRETRELLPAYLRTLTAGQLEYADMVRGIASPDVKDIFDTLMTGDEKVSAEEYKQVKEVALPKFQAVYQDYFDEHKLDAMIIPTTALTAKRIGSIKDTIELNGKTFSTFKALSRNTAPGSVAGVPGITIPIGLSSHDKLPVGISIDGPTGSDERLLSIALTLEKILALIPPPI